MAADLVVLQSRKKTNYGVRYFGGHHREPVVLRDWLLREAVHASGNRLNCPFTDQPRQNLPMDSRYRQVTRREPVRSAGELERSFLVS